MGPLSRPGGSMICIPQKIELVVLSRDTDTDADSVCY